jgi:glycosyltransferase involved in cell wall biosynthesis
MKIGYLMNTYPMTSTTFIRREIEALETLGLEIVRYAGRRWSEALVDRLDIEEAGRTSYLLTGNASGLFVAVVKEFVVNPLGLARGILTCAALIRHGGGGIVKNAAYLAQAVHLRQRADADGIQHLHVHFSTNASTIALLSRVMGGVDFSFTAHGPDEFLEARRCALEMKIKSAAFVVAISNFCKAQLILLTDMKYWEKIRVIRCGLTLDEFQPTDRPGNDSMTVVCVGRLCPQKGQLLIPRAVATLKGEFPGLKVILIGGGESRDEIEAEIDKHGVRDVIELPGWKANDEVRHMISRSRVLLLPSLAEGLPIVIMEALALRRPVISTYIAGIPELLDEQCGWIIPAASADALATALRSALTADWAVLERMGKTGRARVEALHDIGHSARLLFACFLPTAERHHSSALSI